MSKYARILTVIVLLLSLRAAADPLLQGTLSVLHNFSVLNSDFENGDGARPDCSLIQAPNGNLYGTAVDGGANANGVVFRVNAYGSYTTVHTFAANDGTYPYSNSDGSHPVGKLILADDNCFYGTTVVGGEFGSGTVYRMTQSGIVTVLHSFSSMDSQQRNSDGAIPQAGLVQASDGNFYGTTAEGGSYGVGTVFEITSSGLLTTLHVFDGIEGAYPQDVALVEGNNGSLYGAAADILFKIKFSGAFQSLYHFSNLDSSGHNADGAGPIGSLIQAANGFFYGTAGSGGANGSGTIFKLKSTGVFTVLYTFPAVEHKNVNYYGARPTSLIQANDGVFYGTTAEGGEDGVGTIFKINYGGLLKTLYSFNGIDAHDPPSALLQVGERGFYGTAPEGGAFGFGTIYRFRAAQ